MKKLVSVCLFLLSSITYAKTTPDIYEVYDLTNDKILMSKSENSIHSMASLTKLMTAHVFLKNYPKNLNECISKISEDDKDTIKNTHTRIDKDKKISCENLLQLMLLVSDNYAASAIAGSLPYTTREEFYILMNKEAQMIGMKNTYYKDATGLSFENKTTATDLLKLIKVINQNEKLKDLSSMYGLQLNTGDKIVEFKNSNKLIRENLYSADISKTGYISESGYNLIFIPKSECEKRKIALIIMGAKTSEHRTSFAKEILEKYSCAKN